MNMRKFIFALFISLVTLNSTDLLSVPAKGLIKIESKQQLDKYLKMGKPVVLIFSTDWCSACKASAPTIEWAIQAYPNVLFLLVDGDFAPTKSLKSQYQIGAFPTFLLFKADGTKVYQDAHSISSRGFMEDLLRKITTVNGSAAPTPEPVMPKQAPCVNPKIESYPQETAKAPAGKKIRTKSTKK